MQKYFVQYGISKLAVKEMNKMVRTRNKNTKPERRVFWVLRQLGYDFTTHAADLPGTPDIVLREHKIAIFVHGCFWHNHGCPMGKLPKKDREIWKRKFYENKKRFRKNKSMLQHLGWKVITVWECTTFNQDKLEEFLLRKLHEISEQ